MVAVLQGMVTEDEVREKRMAIQVKL